MLLAQSDLNLMKRDRSADYAKMRTALHDTTLPTGGGLDGSQPIGKQSKSNRSLRMILAVITDRITRRP